MTKPDNETLTEAYERGRAEVETLLNTPFPCPRCGRSDLLLRHMIPEPGRQYGHAPCLSRTDAEEEADLALFDAETRIAQLETVLRQAREALVYAENGITGTFRFGVALAQIDAVLDPG